MQSIKYAVYQKWVPKSVVKMQQIKLQFKLIVYSVYSCYQTFSPENLSYLQSLQQMHSKIWHVPTYIHTMHEKYVPELIVKILSISVDTEETLQSRDFSLSSQTFYLKIAVTYLLTRRNCLNKISCMIAVSLFLSLSPTHHVGTTLQRNTDTKTLNLDAHVHLLSVSLSRSLSLLHTHRYS